MLQPLKVAAFFTLALLFTISSTAATEIQFSEYLNRYVQKSSAVQAAHSNWMTSKARYDDRSSVARGALSLSPFYEWQETKGFTTLPNREIEGPSVASEWRQQLPGGLATNLSVTQTWSDEGSQLIYSAELEQALWKNAFGGAQRNLKKAAVAELSASKLNYIHEYVVACTQGITSYLDAWKAQSLAAAAKESYELSQAVLRNTRRNYQRKLISILDYNSARVDALSTQDSFEDLRVESDAKLATVVSYFSSEPADLEKTKIQPPVLPESTDLDKVEDRELLDVRLRKQVVEARQAEHLAAKYNNRTAVNLFGNIQQKDTNYDQGLNADTKEWQAQLGLRLEWPTWNKELSAEVMATKAALLKAESELHAAERTSRIELLALRSQVENLRAQLKRSEERLNLRNAQVKEARRLLNIGRIEFENYVDFRDAALAEISKNVEIQKALWASHLSILEKQEQVPPICGRLQL